MVQIHLSDDVVASLTAQAHEAGLSLEAYLGRIAVHGGVVQGGSEQKTVCESQQPRLTVEEFDALLDEELRIHAGREARSSYQGTYPRSEIYVDHD